jgi:chromosome segregation ATPase
VIEYALLFGLGFVAALLVGMLLAPAIHRRIVKFTEDRIMATVPVSPQELRAQKDMVRAEMAAAVARTGHDLKVERARAAQLSIANDQLSAEAARLYGENSDLKREIETLNHDMADLRASLRNEEIRLEQMREQLARQEESERQKDARIEELLHRINRLGIEIDNLKIDIATRDTEAESYRVRINALRDERETLREELKAATQRAKDAELKLAREENRVLRLEEQLNTAVSGNVDKDTIIERRVDEIKRLKERLKAANAEAREAARSARATANQRQSGAKVKVSANNDKEASIVEVKEEPAEGQPSRIISAERAAQLVEDVRAKANAAADALAELDNPDDDERIREEIADIAAKMIAVTGQREGASSPIHKIISTKVASGREDRTSLSERASRLLHQD